MLAHFLLWYGGLRIVVDLFRDYPTTVLGVGMGQFWNGLTALMGVLLLIRQSHTRPQVAPDAPPPAELEDVATSPRQPRRWPRLVVLGAILVFSLTIRSGWSQGALAELRRQRAPGDDRAVSEADRPVRACVLTFV
jgi:phosphatidylglycerol:prolipoprotein diacylglycerol transferase